LSKTVFQKVRPQGDESPLTSQKVIELYFDWIVKSLGMNSKIRAWNWGEGRNGYGYFSSQCA